MKKSLILLLFTISLFSQNKLEVKQLGFSMDKPENWMQTQEKGLVENLDRFDLSKEQREQMLKSLNSASGFIAYYKYDPLKSRGIIPTINIVARNTKITSNDKFKVYVIKVGEKMKTLFENFTESEPVSKIINGAPGWEVISSYDYKDPTGKKVKLTSKTIYFYQNDFYVSVSLVEELGKEDNTSIFDKVVDSVKFDNLKKK